jgi:uncharacterized protein DUF664
VRLPWWEPENAQQTMDTGGDMYAAPSESTEFIVDLYRRACAHADQTIAELDLDTVGTVPHADDNDPGVAPDPPNPKQITLRQALVHMIHETSRHAGHADIVRELIDGAVGGARNNPYVPDWAEETWWQDYLGRVEASAAAAEQ